MAMDELINASECTDREWYDDTEGNFCGGCGNEAADCHPGHPCGEVRDPFGMHDSICDLCPTRLATGQLTALRAVG